MDFLRTPDERFTELTDFPFAAHYLQVSDFEQGQLRMHYLDEGDEQAEVVLMLHGEPSWSYLYRKMIPIVVQAGYRVIAPDLIGFGRSDKPTSQQDYSYQRHVDWLQSLLNQLELTNVSLMCQDWGGLLGLRLVADNPTLFARVCAANTFLPTGDQGATEAFMKWHDFSQSVEVFPVSGVIKGATTTALTPEVLAAYNAPFPDESFKAGVRVFPTLVPITADNPASQANRDAWEILKRWDKPFLTAFSDSDPVTAGGDRIFQKLIPGCQGQNHVTIENGGHFLQEDQGEVLATHLVDFLQANPIK